MFKPFRGLLLRSLYFVAAPIRVATIEYLTIIDVILVRLEAKTLVTTAIPFSLFAVTRAHVCRRREIDLSHV